MPAGRGPSARFPGGAVTAIVSAHCYSIIKTQVLAMSAESSVSQLLHKGAMTPGNHSQDVVITQFETPHLQPSSRGTLRSLAPSMNSIGAFTLLMCAMGDTAWKRAESSKLGSALTRL